MRNLPAIVLLSVLCSARGSYVLWNSDVLLNGRVYENASHWVLYMGYSVPDDYWGAEDLPNGGTFGNSFHLDVEEASSDGLRKLMADMPDCGREFTVVSANSGDVIDAESVSDKSRLFVTNMGSVSDWLPIEYRGDNPVSIYLGIEAEIWGWGYSAYGWIELIADNYELRLGNTCLDLSGRPVVVGVRSAEPVPEPASGALALLGAALLFRRRRGRAV